MICFVNYGVICCESYVLNCCVNYVECFAIYAYCYDLAYYDNCTWCDFCICDVGVCVNGFEIEKSYVIFVCVPSAKETDHLLPWPKWPVHFHYWVHWC